jgi:hypothetical protein
LSSDAGVEGEIYKLVPIYNFDTIDGGTVDNSEAPSLELYSIKLATEQEK